MLLLLLLHVPLHSHNTSTLVASGLLCCRYMVSAVSKFCGPATAPAAAVAAPLAMQAALQHAEHVASGQSAGTAAANLDLTEPVQANNVDIYLNFSNDKQHSRQHS
jgi:hypothetical protein